MFLKICQGSKDKQSFTLQRHFWTLTISKTAVIRQHDVQKKQTCPSIRILEIFFLTKCNEQTIVTTVQNASCRSALALMGTPQTNLWCSKSIFEQGVKNGTILRYLFLETDCCDEQEKGPWRICSLQKACTHSLSQIAFRNGHSLEATCCVEVQDDVSHKWLPISAFVCRKEVISTKGHNLERFELIIPWFWIFLTYKIRSAVSDCCIQLTTLKRKEAPVLYFYLDDFWVGGRIEKGPFVSLASWPSFPWHSTQRRWAISASNPFLLLPLLAEMRLSIVQSLQGLGPPLVLQIRCPLSYTTRLLCPSAAAGTLVLCLRSGSRVHKPLHATSPWRHRNFYRLVFSRILC